jgi:thymidylate synthase (FAD)
MRNWHSTPFEMCEIKYHVKLPIFIARQWIRHRTANVNEYSARYSILDKEFYLPEPEHLAAQSQNNRQGRGDVLKGEQAKKVLNLLKNDAEQTYNNYEMMLNERYDGSVIDEKEVGLARELARMNLTLNTYTQWYWKTDLLNLMNFLRLRADHHAQYEIRAYAEAMVDTLKKWVPITYEAFMDYRVGGTEVSAKGKAVLQKLIQREEANIEKSGLSKREWNELMTSFGLKDKLI